MKWDKMIKESKYLPYDIYDHCMEKPNSVQSLLFSQMATNPNAFKLSSEAIEHIEKRSTFRNKLLTAIEYAIREKLVKYPGSSHHIKLEKF